MKLPPDLAAKCLRLAGGPPEPTGEVRVPVPPSTNNLFATVRGRRVTSREYRRWQAAAVPLLTALPRVTAYPVRCALVVAEHVRGSRDLDNMIKPVLDAAKKAGVIVDDTRSCVTEITITYRPDDAGGVVVRFEV